MTRVCPCLAGLPYDECCGPFISGTALAPTAERLMRSRYTAFSRGATDYLLASWHPSTRPEALELDPAVRWIGLEILSRTGGGLLDREGTVEFVASYAAHGERASQHENSTFVRENGQWFYVDAVQ